MRTILERSFGGGTHHEYIVVEDLATVESARFLALQEDALRRADEASEVEDLDEGIAALKSAIRDWANA